MTAPLAHPAEPVTIAAIKAAVAAEWRLTTSDLESCRRGRDVARPRQVAMYLAKNLTPLSFPQIGRYLGNRDHTTVMHGCSQIEKLRLADEDLDLTIARLRRRLRGPLRAAQPAPADPELTEPLQPAFFHGPLFDLAAARASSREAARGNDRPHLPPPPADRIGVCGRCRRCTADPVIACCTDSLCPLAEKEAA